MSLGFVLLIGSCSKPKVPSADAASATPQGSNLAVGAADRDSCLSASQQFLGSRAVMLRCGHLSDAANLDAVAALRVPGLKEDNERGVPISKLLILRRGQLGWQRALAVDKEITNSAGYVGIDFIDDSHLFPYFRVSFSDQGSGWGPAIHPNSL